MSRQAFTVSVQQFGRALSSMVMPNISAFIAWGLLTAIFIPGGWFPNPRFAALIDPMLKYLLPLLVGASGGRLIAGERGAVGGAIATMGVILGSDIPMFLGAMIVGPLSGWLIRTIDRQLKDKIAPGFEMLVNNYSSGILAAALAIIGCIIIGPVIEQITLGLKVGVNFLMAKQLLPFTSILIEPAKVLFLNNALNHAVFSQIGLQEATAQQPSLFFLLEANPGPGLGVLLAYLCFAKGSNQQSAGGAIVIHALGGIHEIYFPFVMMKPKLFVAVILGGTAGIYTLMATQSGMVSPASPGSILAILSATPKGYHMGVLVSILTATAASFAAAGFILKTDRKTATISSSASIAGQAAQSAGNLKGGSVQPSSIIVACDAGMGSSAMGATLLQKKLNAAQLGHIRVSHTAINNLPEQAEWIITHQSLTPRAQAKAPHAKHFSLSQFLDTAFYDQLIAELGQVAPEASNAEIDTKSGSAPVLFTLSEAQLALGCHAESAEEAIRAAGQQLVALGHVPERYVEAMLAREAIGSTYLGEGIAVPHGTEAAKETVIHNGIVIQQYPQGVPFGTGPGDRAFLVIGIAAKGEDHLSILSQLTSALDQPERMERLRQTSDPAEFLALFSAPTGH